MMHFHSADYRKDSAPARRHLLNRGFWLFGVPRPLATCHLLGHKPVVDGTEGFRGRPGSRWVCCDRCGIRPEPQGHLDPDVWDIGMPYPLDRRGTSAGFDPVAAKAGPCRGFGAPGGWPARLEGTVGGQLIIGGRTTLGVEVKLGNCGSEHVLAAHAGLPWIGALYLHTEQFGTWLQRRLNPAGYESKVISVDVFNRRVYWRLWANRNEGSGGSNWRDSSVRIDPRDIAWGEKRYSYAAASDPVTVAVTMPDGDSYDVTMTLQRQTFGRPGRHQKLSWTVKCSHGDGIPHRNHDWKDGLCGWSVPVSADAAEHGTWPREAAAASAAKVASLRIRYSWKPPTTVP